MREHMCRTISSRGIHYLLIAVEGGTIINTTQKRVPSARVVEIERMKGVRYFKACNCGSKTCPGHCADAAAWRKDFITNYGRAKQLNPAELAAAASTEVATAEVN